MDEFKINLEMSLINCEIWSADYLIWEKATTFVKTDTKLLKIVTLSTKDNAKLLQQLKSGLKQTVNWNRYQLKVSSQKQNL